MSIWWRGRSRKESRDAGLPGVPLNQILAKLKTGSYADVDLSSAESALQSVAVYAATDLICSIGSELPIDVFRGKGPDKTALSMPGHLEDPSGAGYGLEDFCYMALWSWLLRGNLYANILDRTPSGVLRQVDLFHPDHVNGELRSGRVVWNVDGQEIPESRMLHRRVNPVPGYIKGLSPIQMHAHTIGLNLTAGKFGLQWFKDGAVPGALLTNTEVDLDQDQADTVKARFMAAVRGNREPVVFGKGWKYDAIQLNAEESQFLATQGYSSAECARIFGPGIAEILGYETGGSMTYANIQDRELTLLKYSVGKWLRRLERLLSAFLPRPQYVRFNRDALLETNTVQRYLAYASALTNNWQTINEVRELQDMTPVPWGDAPFTAGPAAASPEPAPGDPGPDPEE